MERRWRRHDLSSLYDRRIGRLDILLSHKGVCRSTKTLRWCPFASFLSFIYNWIAPLRMRSGREGNPRIRSSPRYSGNSRGGASIFDRIDVHFYSMNFTEVEFSYPNAAATSAIFDVTGWFTSPTVQPSTICATVGLCPAMKYAPKTCEYNDYKGEHFQRSLYFFPVCS